MDKKDKDSMMVVIVGIVAIVAIVVLVFGFTGPSYKSSAQSDITSTDSNIAGQAGWGEIASINQCGAAVEGTVYCDGGYCAFWTKNSCRCVIGEGDHFCRSYRFPMWQV